MDPATIRDPRLLAELAKRGDDPDATAERIVARHVRLLARELEALDLTEHQATLLWHAVGASRLAKERGTPFASFAEALEHERERLKGSLMVHALDIGDLVERAAGWSPATVLAVWDAIERVNRLFNAPEPAGVPTAAEAFRAAGLVRGDAGEHSLS